MYQLYIFISITALMSMYVLANTLPHVGDVASTVILPLPPKNLMFMVDKKGYLDFLQMGATNFALLSEFGLNLGSKETSLLDMGSGYGRLLAGIIVSLGNNFVGSYTGMDILKRHVLWCQSSYEKYFPDKVKFVHLDVFNARYNPTGLISPSNFTIPAGPTTYSFISLFSVFTHMHEGDILHYLHELQRILRPGGTIVATVFIYNSYRLKRVIDTGYGALVYNNHTRIKSTKDPLFAIVYDESWFADNIIAKSGLVLERLIYGSALGDPLKKNKKQYPDLYQDLIVLRKSQ
jgi:SAM-dependent methyltransferase